MLFRYLYKLAIRINKKEKKSKKKKKKIVEVLNVV